MIPTQHSDNYPTVPSEHDPQFADELLLGELTAALAADAVSAEDELPPELARLATQSGEAVLRAQRLDGAAVPAAPAGRAPIVDRPIVPAVATTRLAPLRAVAIWGGWLSAAAMLAFMVSDSVAKNDAPLDGGAEFTAAIASAAPSDLAVALQDSLVANDATLLRGSFAGTDDPAGVGASGEVLWSGAAQRGVMRLVGLQPNDRTQLQYQLWIFDAQRDQRYPVDGGVFDVPAGATEVLIPINAKVSVGEAAMFAITVEPAGGVVVSSRERIALLAEL